MNKIPAYIFFVFTVIQGCTIGTFGTDKNDQIDDGLRQEMSVKNHELLSILGENDMQKLKPYLSDALLQNFGEFEQFLHQISGVVEGRDWQTVDEYYTKNSKSDINNTFIVNADELNEYKIHYKALCEEMYLTLLSTKSGVDELGVLLIYGKYPEGWKVNIIQLGELRVDGQTGPELYDSAKSDYENGKLMTAALKMYLAERAARPFKSWEYNLEEEILKFKAEVLESANSEFNFPLVISSLTTNPKIFNVHPERTVDGYLTLISYQSEIPLEDTVKLKQENDAIHLNIEQVFSGITSEKKYLAYKAYNTIPDGSAPVKNYGFVKELNN